MNDGWKYPHARATVGAALALGLTGLGVVQAAPATAAPDDRLKSRIDAAQAAVDDVAPAAAAADRRHDRAQTRVTTSTKRVKTLTKRIVRAKTLAETVREQVATDVLAEHQVSGGSTAPSATSLPADSEVLLSNVSVVSEDTDGRIEQVARSQATAQQLTQRRAQVRQALVDQRATAKKLAAREATAAGAVDRAQGKVDALEAELAERREEREAEQAAAAPAAPAAPDGSASSAVSYAMAQVGKAYVWGASGPSSFDCSGLTMAAWATQGVSLPHNSGAQYAAGTPVSESELQPGDLVFYYSPISHVGLYVGNGQVVNALNPGSGVQVSGLHDMPYSGAVRPG
ncbi:C40 family peptidase [Nocardioides aurantiacus]|uniref:Cell wall-associated NlpC family hydrolase n=1 Tax=Nocardioides aurantiacus TaxID=86796 RepID=A0A3N2CSE7_9ACTN|nr:C40 family peptidase [Nocardioides aurantiacus]ROR90445.1 cell wall-associated NlpC family hydrolase [Nocardioides aurantiacus]